MGVGEGEWEEGEEVESVGQGEMGEGGRWGRKEEGGGKGEVWGQGGRRGEQKTF